MDCSRPGNTQANLKDDEFVDWRLAAANILPDSRKVLVNLLNDNLCWVAGQDLLKNVTMNTSAVETEG